MNNLNIEANEIPESAALFVFGLASIVNMYIRVTPQHYERFISELEILLERDIPQWTPQIVEYGGYGAGTILAAVGTYGIFKSIKKIYNHRNNREGRTTA